MLDVAVQMKKAELRELPILLQINVYKQLYGRCPTMKELTGGKAALKERLILLRMILFRTIRISRYGKSGFFINIHKGGETDANNTSFGYELVLREH